MYCKSCGRQISDADKFCAECGARTAGDDSLRQGKVPASSGRFHRICIAILVVWTAFWAGLTFSAFGWLGEEAERSTGALIGFGLGLVFYAFVWFLPSMVLAITAIATKPNYRVEWSSGSKWTTGLLAAFFFFIPQLPHLIARSSETIPYFSDSRIAANEASVVGTLRTINTAAVTYQSTYNNGFPPDFAHLGGPPPGNCELANLIDTTLTTVGQKSGYIITYTALKLSKKAARGCVNAGAATYVTNAVPLSVKVTGYRTFCSDESGAIHLDSVGGAAQATDTACEALSPLQ